MRRSSFVLLALLLTVLAVGPAAAEPHGGSPEPGTSAPAAPAPSPSPEALLQNVRSVEVGYYHSCAILTNRQVRCWGYNYYGQLGDGSDDDSETAVIVQNGAGTGPLQNVIQLALGNNHTCALLTNHQVRCWGQGSSGQIGNGDTDNSSLPKVVRNAGDTGPLQNVIQISGEAEGACALLSNHQIRCWGEDDYGQLGNGLPKANSPLPVIVQAVGGGGALTGIAGLGGGYDNNCARTQGGQARCWGYQGDGALGSGDTTESQVPIVVQNAQTGAALTNVTQVVQSGYHGCARLGNGQARCWGDNGDGELGTGGTTDNTRAVLVRLPNGNPLTGIVRIEVGIYSTCALLTNDQVRCWGDDGYGQNADGTIEDPEYRKSPTLAHGTGNTGILSGVTQLAGKSYHFCVRLSNGQARCWGYNSEGGLGNADITDDTPYPVRVQI